jgi:uncharacterized membrane protein YjdF
MGKPSNALIGLLIGVVILSYVAGYATVHKEFFRAVHPLIYIAALIWIYKKISYISTSLKIALVAIAIINAAGFVFRFFTMPGPYDEITHTATLFVLTLCINSIFEKNIPTAVPHREWIKIVLLIAAPLALGAAWEIGEWFILRRFPSADPTFTLDDTITDLLWDSLGTISALCLIHLFNLKLIDERQTQSTLLTAPHN